MARQTPPGARPNREARGVFTACVAHTDFRVGRLRYAVTRIPDEWLSSTEPGLSADSCFTLQQEPKAPAHCQLATGAALNPRLNVASIVVGPTCIPILASCAKRSCVRGIQRKSLQAVLIFQHQGPYGAPDTERNFFQHSRNQMLRYAHPPNGVDLTWFTPQPTTAATERQYRVCAH